MRLRFSSKKGFISLLLMFLLADLTILLDIPVMRQVIGFFFLTVLPGILILKILKLGELEFIEKFVLSIGISISCLMLFGLLINNLSLSLGYETPLATIPLLISFNIIYILLAIVGYKINKNSGFSIPWIKFTVVEKIFLFVPIVLPALSIYGIYLMNTTSNNIVVMFLLVLIPIYVTLICFFNQKFPNRIYPVVIFLISISLLLLMSLRSGHIIGVDAHLEYYFFKTTLNNLHWSVFGHSTLDACLSISLLPTIYLSLLNIPPEFLFKILYSVIYSISPLIIYILSKKYIGELYGFLASCFFMFQQNFLWTAYNPRTNTAILFFALAMMTLFNDKIDPLKKKILFITFIVSCIVSHYSTTYIFFIIMLVAFVGIEIISKKYTLKKVISLTIVLIFFTLIVFWYSQVTETAFNAGVNFIKNTFINLNKFFIEESRGGGVPAMLGEGIMEKGIPHKIEFVFTWLTFAFIGIGVITMIIKHKEMSFPELKLKKPNFLRKKFEVEYSVIAIICSGLLVAMVALPLVSKGYDIQRSYAPAITILSVFFVIGGIIIANYLNVQVYLIILLVLVPYSLCVTGVMYNLFGIPRAITLNSQGEQYDLYYIHDQDSYAGNWFGRNYVRQGRFAAYVADESGSRALRSSAIFNREEIDTLSFSEHKKIDGYIYLRYYNVVNGKLFDKEYKEQDIVDYQDKFIEKGKVYNNGGAEIWR